jgi:hypothetical protein
MAMKIAVGTAALVARAFRAGAQGRILAEPRQLAALSFARSIAAVPFLLSYDTLVLCLAALALLAANKLDSRGRRLARLVYWLPLIQISLGTLHIPGSALIAPAFALYLFLNLKSQTAAAPHTILRQA